MKSLVLIVVSILGVVSSSHAGTFKGKCVKQAISAAIQEWADVPNPSEDLFYTPVSAGPISARSATYEVVLGIYDLNGYMAHDKFVVQMKDLKSCELLSIDRKN